MWDKEYYEETLKEDRTKYTLATPYRHLLIENFLTGEGAEKLLKALEQEKFTHKESDLFSLRQTADFIDTKNETLKKIHALFKSQDFRNWIFQLTGKKSNEEGTIDMTGTLYTDGDYLLCHDDQLSGRKIAFVLYLSKEFEEKDGGGFQIINNKDGAPNTIKETLPPKWNSIMLFEVNEKSYHAVQEVMNEKKRYAIGGWIH